MLRRAVKVRPRRSLTTPLRSPPPYTVCELLSPRRLHVHQLKRFAEEVPLHPSNVCYGYAETHDGNTVDVPEGFLPHDDSTYAPVV